MCVLECESTIHLGSFLFFQSIFAFLTIRDTIIAFPSFHVRLKKKPTKRLPLALKYKETQKCGELN